MNNVIIYGTTYCPKCKQLVTMCDKEELKYSYVNVEPGDVEFKELLQANVKSFPALKINNSFVHTNALPDLFSEIKQAQAN